MPLDLEEGTDTVHSSLCPLRSNLNVYDRVCPGKHFAEDSLFITMASILATFDISKALDEEGMEITPSAEYTDSAITYAFNPHDSRGIEA